MNNIKISVLGGGAFGTSIAHLLAKKGLNITLWAREKDVVNDINNNHQNTVFFKDHALHPFNATSDVKKAITQKDILIFAIPCQFIHDFLNEHKAEILSSKCLMVNLAKGIEITSLKTPSQIFESVFDKKIHDRFASLSGPTFAKELYLEMPSGAALASTNQKTATTLQNILSQRFFRLYTIKDVIGLELGGALKNVMAIGVGISDGLGFGLNSRAGLITRMLHEMKKLGLAMGAQAETFSGLSGIGDLILTCTGDLSRNRQVGLKLGQGEKLQDLLNNAKHVAEGVSTTKAVYLLSQKLSVTMPNTEQIYKILYENLSPKQAIENVLSRDLKDECQY